MPSHEQGRAYQWDTLVLGRHRGHRLGLALKVQNLRAMQSAHPEVARVETWNAEQNGPMVAVNEELGFEVLQQAPLPLPERQLEALAAEAAEHSAGYRVEVWTGPCPDEYAVAYARLKGRLRAEAPAGELPYEAEHWDVERLRAQEATADEKGRVVYTAVAVETRRGALVGHTQVAVDADHRGRAGQADTLVEPAHRGHRLGLALKVANLRAVQADLPGLDRITTSNAAQNAPMLAVNERFGFVPYEVTHTWYGDV